jgi:hypothetical protein
MKIIGRVMLNDRDARQIVAGATIDLPRTLFTGRMLKIASIGDLAWVAEPFRVFKSGRFGRQHIHEIVPGPYFGPNRVRLPKNVAPYMAELRMSLKTADMLRRCDSRCTLEIMSLGPDAVRCLIHMRQADQLLKGLAR